MSDVKSRDPAYLISLAVKYGLKSLKVGTFECTLSEQALSSLVKPAEEKVEEDLAPEQRRELDEKLEKELFERTLYLSVNR